MPVSPSSIFVIIPCFNEASVILETVTGVLEKGYRVVVVDDASTDDTKQRLKGLPVHYLRHRINLGQGAALQTGMDHALKNGASFLITFDADGQHMPADIAGMVETLEMSKLDIVFGSRFLKGSGSTVPQGRKWLLKLARYVNYFFSGILLSDAHNGFRCLNRKAAEKIRLRENRMAHASEILIQVARLKLSYAEYPVKVHYTAYSIGKGQGNRHGLRILFELILYKLFR